MVFLTGVLSLNESRNRRVQQGFKSASQQFKSASHQFLVAHFSKVGEEENLCELIFMMCFWEVFMMFDLCL